MATLVGLVAIVFVLAGPLWLLMGRIHRRAGAHRVGRIGPLFLSLFGYLGGVIAAVYASLRLLDAAYPSGAMPGPLIFLALLLSSAIGSAIGSSLGYAWVWFRTTSDVDYDDCRPAGRAGGLKRR